MLEITFEINGQPVTSDSITDALERAVFSAVEEGIRSKLAGIRDPDTGEFPVVAARGRNLENLTFEVSGSEELIALVTERLGTDGDNDADEAPPEEREMRAQPCAFLCHASEDKEIVRRIAKDFQANGIDTFFDEWEIGPGDSLRQKIDTGLDRCTHFIVVLSSASLGKPWVNAEIDAGFVRKLKGSCHFIPLRYGLDVSQLPPLLSGLASPALRDYDQDIQALIDFIHGASRKPPLGPAPKVIQESSKGKIGLSPAAEAIVKILIESSEHGDAMDPQVEPDRLRNTTGLSDDDLVDAVDELEGQGFIVKHVRLGCGELGFSSVTPQAALFVAFDKHFKDWDPEADAIRVAADLQNDVGDGIVSSMAEGFGWLPRRMNPAVNYLVERRLVDFGNEIGTYPWCRHWISKNHATRRFVRDRS